jgi:CRISPR-associated endoribonuclease Cas6
MTQSPDLYALIIRLTAAQSGQLRASAGRLSHAAFLDILRQVDPDVAQQLHDTNGRKPFTISPLHGFGHRRKGVYHIGAGQEGWLRLTLLDPALFHTFIAYFLQGAPQTAVRLNKMSFQVSEILSTPGSHALAGTDSIDDLINRWQTAVLSRDHRTIHLSFSSPTAFAIRDGRSTRRSHVLPDPYFVFGELANRWDTLTGSETKEAVRQYVSEHMVVARHNIKTHMVQFGRGRQVGFTGRVAYQSLDKENDDMLRHLNRLADFAFYSGVGSKTTMGMGQVMRRTN